MSENTSVLVTTYGPFSFTLNGFDDPFPTMKAIADLMCDLADDEALSDIDITEKSDEIAGIAKQVSGHHIDIRASQSAIILYQRSLASLDRILDGSFLEEKAKQDQIPPSQRISLTETQDDGSDQPLFGAKKPVYKTTRPKSEDLDINSILSAISRSKSEAADNDKSVLPETDDVSVSETEHVVENSFEIMPSDTVEIEDAVEEHTLEVEGHALENNVEEYLDAKIEQDDIPIADPVAETIETDDVAPEKIIEPQTPMLQDSTADTHHKPARAFLELDENGNEREDMISRIFHKTNRQLDAPETGRRQNALAHLKAAVVVTSADREAGVPLDDDGEALGHYREDLAHVFDEAAEDERKTSVAPLQLVAENRIDNTESIRKPLRPSRVAANLYSKVNISKEDVDGFATYISEIENLELVDMIEAAGAYISYVQGSEHFTRPLVLKYVALLNSKDGFSREEGLCAFGQLLREGKIQKASNGQYTVSQKTRFKPQQRLAGE
ncbi:hypothetical protein [Parasulfitobacter algicola]|uniref:Lipoprotein n=1 Tax=Parasulfitobacter algicola TaxID=2614809 RepID=A0ABX2IRZ9_9RHOB|nr:hypothetical protein [Sulfitobacter algicola]NSX54791.1 hypothetical protein [Sulfitobacter algicola]